MSETMANDDVPEMTPSARRGQPAHASLGRPLGFIGLGAMGLPMTAALVRAGHAVLACDTDMARLSLAVDVCGAGLHTTPIAGEVGARCGLVFLMLPGSLAIPQVTGDLAGTMAAGGLIVDLGQSDPAETRVLAGALARHGLRLVDAPALGDPARAAAATLDFMVGGGDADFSLLLPYLRAMGQTPAHTGETGSAHEAVRTTPE